MKIILMSLLMIVTQSAMSKESDSISALSNGTVMTVNEKIKFDSGDKSTIPHNELYLQKGVALKNFSSLVNAPFCFINLYNPEITTTEHNPKLKRNDRMVLVGRRQYSQFGNTTPVILSLKTKNNMDVTLTCASSVKHQTTDYFFTGAPTIGQLRQIFGDLISF